MTDASEVRSDVPCPFGDALQHFHDETQDRQPRAAALDDIVDIIRADRDAVDR